MNRFMTLALGASILILSGAIPVAAGSGGFENEVSNIERVTGTVMGYTPAKQIILQLDGGRLVSYSLATTATSPVDLAVGSRVTLGLRYISMQNPQVVDMVMSGNPNRVVSERQKRTITSVKRSARPKLVKGESKLTGFADELVPGKLIILRTLQGERFEMMFAKREFTTDELLAQPGVVVSSTIEELRARQAASPAGRAAAARLSAATQGVTRPSISVPGRAVAGVASK